MNLMPFTDAPFDNEEAFLDFLGQNEAAHVAIGRKLALLGHPVSSPPPIGNPKETPDWLIDHWQRHRDECLTLGIAVPDLTGVDFTQQDQYLDWMVLHGHLHTAQNLLLGITS